MLRYATIRHDTSGHVRRVVSSQVEFGLITAAVDREGDNDNGK